MGVGITNAAVLEVEKTLMKPAISNALITFYATLKDNPITGDQYAIEFADVLVDAMFDRIVTYVATNALVTGSFIYGGPLPPAIPAGTGVAPTLNNGAVL